MKINMPKVWLKASRFDLENIKYTENFAKL